MNNKCKNHGWLMWAGMILMAIVMLLPRLGIELGFMGRLSPFLIFLICPLLHIGMMVFMFKGRNNDDPAEKNPAA